MAEDRCLWTGKPLRPGKGGSERKFASDAARAAAHRAARKYTLALIASGDLTWDRLREWDRARSGASEAYTAAGEEDGGSNG